MCEFNPKILKQTITSIELSWNTIQDCEVYKIEMLSKDETPNRVYWYNRHSSTRKLYISSTSENIFPSAGEQIHNQPLKISRKTHATNFK